MTNTGTSRSSSHGFEFSSDVPLFGLRANAERPLLRVRRGTVVPVRIGKAVGHWPSIPGKRAEVSIVEVDNAHLVRVGTMARFHVDTRAMSIVAQYADQLPTMIETTTLMSSPVALCLTQRGQLAIHASAVEVAGRAILLAAPGTGGKTTLAAAFHIAGHRALSDDLVAVDPGGSVDPAVGLLRLRIDAAEALSTRLEDVTLHLDDVGKRFFEVSAERRGDGVAVPAAAIVFLAWSNDDQIAIEAVTAANAIKDLWRLSFYLSTDPGPAATFERLAALVDRVPAFVIRRPRDFARLDEGVDQIETLLDNL